MKEGIILSVDIGGSHITAALTDMRQRAIIPGSVYRAHVDSHASADDIIDRWCDVMQQSKCASDKIDRIGIAIPGPFDYEQGISRITGLHKYEALYGLNIKDILAERFHIRREYIKLS